MINRKQLKKLVLQNCGLPTYRKTVTVNSRGLTCDIVIVCFTNYLVKSVTFLKLHQFWNCLIAQFCVIRN